ncbi:flagellar basal body P-ring formation chaperone FlgA [Janthinobacterium sp.]|uniref:flagellar basal body P-ring formation chaperone FlgA n=1 Tax=Janthinobacterium sp. TaxID=1871054 RepID=UPI00293D6E23|nr:flagellar basal body P-ring formation chaperone FlgA [Janthinobacterium sp.]
MEKAARAHLAQQAGAAQLREALFEVTVVPTARPLPPCGRGATIEAVDVRQATRMRFAAVCGGAEAWKYELIVRAAVSARVAVSAAPLPAGKALTAQDVAMERRDISAIGDSLAEPGAALGLASRRSLRAGEVLRRGQLVALAVVKRGEAVRIVARRAQVEVSMAGEALDAGAPGALVRVRNTTSGAVIQARVVAAGTVEPADAPGVIQSAD